MTKPAPVVDVGPAEAAHLADAGQALLLDVREDVRNLAGGMTAWAAAGLPVVRGDGTPGEIA